MEESSTPKVDDKPFSVLEQFRQLKKEKEQTPVQLENSSAKDTSETVFKASTSTGAQNGESGFQRGRGRFRGKRNFDNCTERPIRRFAADLHLGQKEADCGITEFIRDGPAFDILLKHRYTDFIVNEIDPEGNVVKLTTTEIPKDNVGSETLSVEEDPTLLNPEQWKALKEIVDNKLSTKVDVDVTDLDKDKRQRIHKAVKKRFGVHVYSNTVVIDGKKIMQVGHASGQNHRFCNWPKDRPEYLHFVVLKENVDTAEVVNVLSRFTRIKAPKFSYAGTKDKRAVTTQRMCVRRADVERFGNCYKARGMAIGNFSYKWSTIRLGDLSGNRFKIALRYCKASDEELQHAFEHLKEKGFINYFGLQRFGQSLVVPTYSVGQAILKGDWKLAVELILKPRPGEACYADVKEAREIWWNTRDATQAMVPLTRKDRSIEGKILFGLKQHGPNAYQNAFDNLTRQTVMMYLHSYQSLIWNKIVSRRIRQFGLKVLPGDLVRLNPTVVDDSELDLQDLKEGEDEEESDEDEEEQRGRMQVRSLSAEEVETASIYDVVYPMPGEDIKLPDNEIAQWYTELLTEDNHSMECFGRMNKKYGMYGAYRTMLEKAEDLTWHTLPYSDPEEDLLLTELDVLRGKPPLEPNSEGSYKAVILEFNLKTCCYATMAIRELTKCETSSSGQAMLTNRAREEDMAFKKQKLEEEEEKKKEEEQKENPAVVEQMQEDKHSNGKTEPLETEPDTASQMETEEISPSERVNVQVDEEGDMHKREADADNIINKFLESNYR